MSNPQTIFNNWEEEMNSILYFHYIEAHKRIRDRAVERFGSEWHKHVPPWPGLAKDRIMRGEDADAVLESLK